MPAPPNGTVSYLLDTSAIIAYLLSEPEAGRVWALRAEAAIPFIALTELYAAMHGKLGQAKADEAVALVKGWHLPLVWPNEASVLLAGRWNARYKMGFGDSYIAALAFHTRTVLVTKDLDFNPLRPALKLLQLSD